VTRDINSTLLDALNQPDIQPYYAVKLEFDSGTLRLWTGYGNRTVNSEIYTGSGYLLSVSGLDEVADLSARNVTISLSGIPAQILTKALAESYQRRDATIYLGEKSVGQVVEVFSGKMDVMEVRDTGSTITVNLNIESKLIELERPNVRRYSEDSHKSRYPTDTFFDFINDLQDKEVVWGREE